MAVEICRTVFEDKRENIVYNVHKHKLHCRSRHGDVGD